MNIVLDSGVEDLRELISDSITGYEPPGYGDQCWILHDAWEADPETGRAVRRIRWQEVLSDCGMDLDKWGYTLSNEIFNSLPLNTVISKPETGSLSRGALADLIKILADYSPGGMDSDCYWAQSPLEDLGSPVEIRLGALAEAPSLRDGLGTPGFPYSFPANWWPADRSWFVYSDSDLAATEVLGSPALISAILANNSLEAVRHPRVSELEGRSPKWLID